MPLAIAIVAAPALLVAALSLPLLAGRPLAERTSCRLVGWMLGIGLAAALSMLCVLLIGGSSRIVVDLGNWISIPEYQFSVKLLFDWLSTPFLLLSFLLCGVIGHFARQYMHREPGFNRFFALFAIFALGITLASVAGTIETLFTGWELVGLSSALLVAFFQERAAPVRNGLRVWSVYRISDAALLIAAVALHGMHGHGDFSALFGAGTWPGGDTGLTSTQAFVVGLLLAIAAAGKSALAPFSGWLPRAMEGPTPSSAIFYGALSVHLGAFLLLRGGPIIADSAALSIILVAWGLGTAVLSALIARVQTDIKSAMSFASLTQVGLIVAEIGCGLRWIPLFHLIGHACLRTLQFVRAPSLLQDYRTLENALGRRLPSSRLHSEIVSRSRFRRWIYRFALERGYLDSLLDEYVVRPFFAVFRWFDSLERRWTDQLTRRDSTKSEKSSASVDHREAVR